MPPIDDSQAVQGGLRFEEQVEEGAPVANLHEAILPEADGVEQIAPSGTTVAPQSTATLTTPPVEKPDFAHKCGVEMALSDLAPLLERGRCDAKVSFLLERYLGQKTAPETLKIADILLDRSKGFSEQVTVREVRKEGLEVALSPEEFAAIGQAVAALAMAIYDEDLCQSIDNYRIGDKRRYQILERRVTDFAKTALLAPDSPVGTLLVREMEGKNNHLETAILRGSLQVLFAVYDENPEKIIDRVLKFFRDRFNGKRPEFVSLKDGPISYRETLLLEQLVRNGEQGEAHRSSVWQGFQTAKRESEQEVVNLEREKARLERRRAKLSSPDAMARELDTILALPTDERLPALVDLLYMGSSLNQDQAVRILKSFPIGTTIGRNGGYSKLREEISARRLGDFADPSFEPIDRLITWLTLHRIEVVSDPAELRKAIEGILPRVLDGSSSWHNHDPKYKVALRRLFAELTDEVCNPAGIKRSVVVMPSADLQK